MAIRDKNTGKAVDEDFDINDAINALAAQANSNLTSAYMAIFATVAAAAQDGFDVESPRGSVVPLSLMFCLSAKSGTGKSTTLRLAMRPIHEYEEKMQERAESELDKYNAQLALYQERLKKLKKMLASAGPEEVHALEEKFTELIKNEPQKPRNYQRIISNATIEGLLRQYDNSRYSPFMEADEGRHAMTMLMNIHAAKLCKLYDGDNFSAARASVKSYAIKSPRFGAIFLLQPGILMDYVREHGIRGLSSGLWARMLIVQNDNGYERPFNPSSKEASNAISIFYMRINKILKKSEAVMMGCDNRCLLKLSPGALTAWRAYVTEVESIKKNIYADSDDACAYLSRAPESLLRLAGIVHLANNYSCGVISANDMGIAVDFMKNFVSNYINLFENGGLDSEVIADRLLLEKIKKSFSSNQPFTKTDIHRIAPRVFRDKKVSLEKSISRLIGKAELEEQYGISLAGKKVTFYRHQFLNLLCAPL
jgi:hypothetical protein